MVQTNSCGHNTEHTLRLFDKGQRRSYCLGCLIQKVGLISVEEQRVIDYKKSLEPKKKVVIEEPKAEVKKPVKKKTTKKTNVD